MCSCTKQSYKSKCWISNLVALHFSSDFVAAVDCHKAQCTQITLALSTGFGVNNLRIPDGPLRLPCYSIKSPAIDLPVAHWSAITWKKIIIVNGKQFE